MEVGKGNGALDEVQEKPGISFKVSPLIGHMGINNSSSKDVWQHMQSGINMGSSSKPWCPGILLGSLP